MLNSELTTEAIEELSKQLEQHSAIEDSSYSESPEIAKRPAWLWIGLLFLSLNFVAILWMFAIHQDSTYREVGSRVKLLVDRALIQSRLNLDSAPTVNNFILRLESGFGESKFILFDQVEVVATTLQRPPNAIEYELQRLLLESPGRSIEVEQIPIATTRWWKKALGNSDTTTYAFKIVDVAQKYGVVIVVLSHTDAVVAKNFEQAKELSEQSVFVLLVSSTALFGFILFIWSRREKVARPAQTAIDKQISSLRNLLTQATQNQQTMQAASSHAVQLNEQFLRRVGSDLHDGPAQSISYAILRLRHFQDRPGIKEIGHEYFALIDSLESALDEIRGISKGLVLPELADLSLHQCLKKVVALHRTKARNTDISEHYVDLPSTIDLGIKICAYRFVQEGLNNAIRHGQASRVRIAASVDKELLRITVKDDGMGFRMSKLDADNTRLGLVGLRDRIESIGGKFNIHSVIGVGTALKLTIKLPKAS